MRKNLVCKTQSRETRVAWLSFQSDDSISFGLTDRSFVSPKFCGRFMLWNAYNRVAIQYVLPTDPNIVGIKNPHFTYHPLMYFHLTSGQGAGSEEVFAGIVGMDIIFNQQPFVPWIVATTAPVGTLQASGQQRDDSTRSPDFIIPAAEETQSLQISVDLYPPGHADIQNTDSVFWHRTKHTAARIESRLVAGQVATLSWFHSY